MSVLLSASIPDPKRGDYHLTAKAVAIREAVLALVTVTLPRQRLIFGGHPAITPLVHQAAVALGQLGRVTIYQSKWFWDKVPAEARKFESIEWTDQEATLPASLAEMRRRMLSPEEEGFTLFTAAVFIGGMDGVEREHEQFLKRHPRVPRYPVASTGAAALRLWEREAELMRDPAPAGGRARLDRETLDALRGTSYRRLFRRVLSSGREGS